MEYFECKVSYQKETGDGKLKPAKDVYIIEAINFADAETRVLEQVRPFVFAGQEVNMQTMRKVNFAEVVPNEQGHYWFKAKVQFTTVDEERGKEKKLNVQLLVEEENMESAYRTVNKLMEQSANDYEILNLQQTAIVEVIRI